MPTTNPLMGSPYEAPTNRVVVDPAQAPGVQNLGGAGVNPLLAGDMTRAVISAGEAQAAQAQEALAQQRAAHALQRAEALAYIDQQMNPAEATPEGAAEAEANALQQTADSTRGIGQTVGDTILSFTAGVGALVQTAGDLGTVLGLADSDNVVSTFGKEVNEGFKAQQSDELKARRELLQQKIDDVEGVGAQMATTLAGYIGSPSLLLDLVAEQVPSLLGSVGVGTAVKAGVKYTAKKTAREVSETLVQRAGLTAAVATNAVQQGASVGGMAYEEIYESADTAKSPQFAALVAGGMTPDEAKKALALEAAREATLGAMTLSVAAQMLPGAMTVERALLRQRAVAGASTGLLRKIGRGGLGGAAKGLAGEGFSEIVEEGGGQYIQNVAVDAVLPGQDLWRGVGQTAGAAGLAGGVLGGLGGAVRGRQQAAADALANAPAADADVDAAGDPIVPGPSSPLPPQGILGATLDSDIQMALPTGFEALPSGDQGAYLTRSRVALKKVNDALAKVGAVRREGRDFTSDPLQMTEMDFVSEPDAVIALAEQWGVKIGDLITLRNEMADSITDSERRIQMAAALDPAFRSNYARLNSTEKAALATELGWDLAELDAGVNDGIVASPENAPTDLLTLVADAFGAVREDARARYAAEQESHMLQAAEENAVRLQNEAETAQRQQAESELAEDSFEAEAALRESQRNAANVWMRSATPAMDPAVAAAEAEARRAAEAQQAFLAAPVVDALPPGTVQFKSANPMVNAALMRAYRQNSRGAVLGVLEQVATKNTPEGRRAAAEVKKLQSEDGAPNSPKR